MSTSTNVLVCCRFRPPNVSEKSAGASVIVKIDDSQKSVNITVDDPAVLEELAAQQYNPNAANDFNRAALLRQYSSFNFDHVFHWDTPQNEVFEKTAFPMVKEVFAGYNLTIFAYG